jgi:hypothetical protein
MLRGLIKSIKMAGYRKDYGSEEFDKNMIWDLRQIYAVDILGQTLKDIRVARVLSDFPLWFKLLKRDLATEISHKLDEAEKPLLKDFIKKTESIIVKNSNAYQKTNCSAEEVQAIEEALCELEMYLKKLMEEHAMFGQKEIDIGL